MNHKADGLQPKTHQLGQLDYSCSYFPSRYPSICCAGSLQSRAFPDKTGWIDTELTSNLKTKRLLWLTNRLRHFKLMLMDCNTNKNHPVHRMTKTGADEHEPAVYGGTAG